MHHAVDAAAERPVEDEFDIGGVHARWDATKRRLRVHHKLGSAPTEADAQRMIPQLTAWAAQEPLDMLVDAEGAAGATMGYRLAWNRWFYDRRGRLRVAVYNTTRLDKHIIPVFATMTGVDIRAFPDEAAATEWLDDKTPPAGPAEA